MARNQSEANAKKDFACEKCGETSNFLWWEKLPASHHVDIEDGTANVYNGGVQVSWAEGEDGEFECLACYHTFSGEGLKVKD